MAKGEDAGCDERSPTRLVGNAANGRLQREGELEERLRAIAGKLGRFPTSRELRALDPTAFSLATNHGGLGRWARRLGFEARGRGQQRRWTSEIIAHDLTAFLETLDHERWPARAEFFRSGQGALYNAMSSHGGICFWAQRSGRARQVAAATSRRPWNDDRIRAELGSFLAARAGRLFPRQVDFHAAGRSDLLHALQRHGGVGVWAAEFGRVPRSRGDRG